MIFGHAGQSDPVLDRDVFVVAFDFRGWAEVGIPGPSIWLLRPRAE